MFLTLSKCYKMEKKYKEQSRKKPKTSDCVHSINTLGGGGSAGNFPIVPMEGNDELSDIHMDSNLAAEVVGTTRRRSWLQSFPIKSAKSRDGITSFHIRYCLKSYTLETLRVVPMVSREWVTITTLEPCVIWSKTEGQT